MWRTSACIVLTRAIASRKPSPDSSRGPRRAASPTASGWDISGTIRKSCLSKSVGTTWASRFRTRYRAGEDVSITTFDATLIAEIDIKGSIDVELRALYWFYLAWLPTSGYAPAHQPMFEAWNGRPFAHGMEHFELRAQLPIVT